MRSDRGLPFGERAGLISALVRPRSVHSEYRHRASTHTELINMFAGLCAKTRGWPHVLYDLGYRVRLVEQTIDMRSGHKINPDVVAVSEDLSHAIVADCKSGSNISAEQDERYGELEPGDLAYHVTVSGPGSLGHAVCYVDSSATHDRLARHTRFPFITFGPNSVVGHGSFGQPRLDEKLSVPTALEYAEVPDSFYPFAPDDEGDVVAPRVLRGLASYVRETRGKALPPIADREAHKRILELVHPHTKAMSSKHRARLVDRIWKMTNMLLSSDRDLREMVRKIEGGEGSQATMQRFSAACERLIKECQGQRRLDSF